MSEAWPCGRRCSHGGACTLDRGHEGKHSAGGFCEFSDEEALSDEEGDLLFMDKNPDMGGLVAIQRLIEGMEGDK